MLFCHPQPESYHQHSTNYIREALAPFLKNEEARLRAASGVQRSPFQYVLCAATSPAVKQQEETLSYLNQDVPLSVGIIEPRSDPLHLNTIEFLWDPLKNASVSIQVNCISTEFTPRKHGGEKGVPFRIQVDTFSSNEHGEHVEHVHSSSCQVKVFKPKGADRKLKTDREKMEKKTPQDREKYQPSHETTLLRECSTWPDALSLSSHSNARTPSPIYHSSPTPCFFTESNCSPNRHAEVSMPACSDHLLPLSSPQDTQQWLHRRRFSPFSRLFSSFSGADLLRMSREDLIQICGPADGIRLFNAMKGRSIQPRLTIYVCQQPTQIQAAMKPGGGDVYHALYLEERTLLDLSEKIAGFYNITPQQITQIYRQKTTGIHILVSDEMVQNLGEEASFIISTIRVGCGGAGALQQSTGGRWVLPGQVTSPSQGHTETHNQAHIPNNHVFGLWEEAGVPRENPGMHAENMQTPCRKTPSRESNPGPSCCKVTVLPTAPPLSPMVLSFMTFLNKTV
ncbi:transcription factor CP2-like protein 1 isoform X2 [Girardinichthys multiradiatus]|uniref:transcription factor CP2-like protein 1 isoform X2 n=1 Tax=Girardinichthys multiradiatus TaxID=208333 RepID=UPI001FABB28E|nr:transcription factor CP2-like protein 1 isoform X2 [Girardinichthys multiradiatus]